MPPCASKCLNAPQEAAPGPAAQYCEEEETVVSARYRREGSGVAVVGGKAGGIQRDKLKASREIASDEYGKTKGSGTA